MLSFYTFSSILVLATVVVCQSDQTQVSAGCVQNQGWKPCWHSCKAIRGVCYSQLFLYSSSFLLTEIKKNRPSLDPTILGLQDKYEIFLNKHYLRPNGAAETIPVAESALDVYVKFKSNIDGYSYQIKCPNKFYWPKDTSQGNTFYIDLDLGVQRGQHPNPIEYVDISKICLYQSREHIRTPPHINLW